MVWLSCCIIRYTLYFEHKKNRYCGYFHEMVGKTGFEPATAWSQTKCSTKLNYFPEWRAQ